MSFRPVPFVLLLAVIAGCGLDDVSAGVEVVPIVDESRAANDRPSRSGADGGSDLVVTAGGAVDRGAGSGNAAVDAPLSALPATVVVVGDSLTLSASDEIEAALTRLGLEVLALDGLENRRMVRGGRDLPPGVAAIADVIEEGLEPDLWIVALGTNDVGSEVSRESFRDDVAEVLTTVPAGAAVMWVDLWIRDRAEAAAAANSAIRSVTAMRPATAVVDWYSHGDDPGVITSDGVHLTDTGRLVFADSMASGVESMYAG